MALVRFIKQLLDEFGRDKVGQLSAAFAYLAIFSIGPLLLVLVSVVGFIFGERAVQGTLFTQLSELVGPATAKTLQTVVAHTHQSGGGVVALILGTVGLLLGASGISSQLQNSFNTIFQIVPDPRGGLKRTVYVKIKNVVLVMVGGIAVAASVAASTLIVGLGHKLQEQLSMPTITLELLNNLASLLVFVTMLYLVYRVLPDVRIPRQVVFMASLAVAVLFMVGKILLGVIIGRNGTASAYGAAASLITLLLWIYYSGQIIFLGAEAVKVYGYNRGLSFEPKKFNLKRTTVHLDARGLPARLAEAFVRGTKKAKK